MPGRGVADSLTSMGNELSVGLHYNVYLRSRQSAPEEHLWRQSPVGGGLHDLGEHRRFHDGASEGAGSGMFGISQAGQMAQRPHVGEIDLGGLDEALADVREVGAEHESPGRSLRAPTARP